MNTSPIQRKVSQKCLALGLNPTSPWMWPQLEDCYEGQKKLDIPRDPHNIKNVAQLADSNQKCQPVGTPIHSIDTPIFCQNM